MGDRFGNKWLGPMVGRNHVCIAGGKLDAVHDEACDKKAGGSDDQCNLDSDSRADGTPIPGCRPSSPR